MVLQQLVTTISIAAANFIAFLLSPLMIFFAAANRFWIGFLFLSLFFAYAVIALTSKTLSIRNFWHKCFNRDVYLHWSAKLDYQFLYTNGLLRYFILPFVYVFPGAYLGVLLSEKVQAVLLKLGVVPIFTPDLLNSIIIYTLVLALAYDFGLFFAHYLEHNVPILWEFHKVHHTAETLTPITVARQHLMDDILSIGLGSFFAGLADGALKSICFGPTAEIMLFGNNLLFFLFFAFAYHLRHSTIWLDYGKWLDHIFISPAQHQIHHSLDRKHWNKNFGFIFSIWDSMFGSLYVPNNKEEIQFGLSDQNKNEYDQLWKLYFLPFVKVWQEFQKKPMPVLKQVAGISCLAIFIILLPVTLGATDVNKPVCLEDLTSNEVSYLIRHGYTTVLVPTGGLEQGGPHLVLGKHNYVVKQTCERIARRLGNTLVAPVIPFSPAGNINPPSAHMQFAGTISLDIDSFERILEAVACSLKQHGFKLICFIGDHGWAIDPQKHVAEDLSRKWANEHVKVVNVSDYYLQNGQPISLVLMGRSLPEIGNHAGLRDTSELMAVYPGGVRMNLLGNYLISQKNGANGDSKSANAALGEKLLNMKVRAATQQILRYQQYLSSSK